MPTTAVLLNDTRYQRHFGCYRVMRVIEANLASRGIRVVGRSLVQNRWWDDKPFLKALSSADVIVINGEGTCHHGSRNAENLLRIVDHPARATKPVALINALYQENPPEWRRYLDRMDVISPRDSWSAAELTGLTGRQISHLPDLSLAEGFHPDADLVTRDLLTVGGSVRKDMRRILIDLSRRRSDVQFLPIMINMKSRKPTYPWPLRKMRDFYVNGYTGLFKLGGRDAIFSRDEAEYTRYLLRSYLHVTGRFHAACFSLTTKTPFAALTSNAWKIEALVEDMGVDRKRVVDPSVLDDIVRYPRALEFTQAEAERVDAAMARGVAGTRAMFDTIADMARLRKAA